jgi:hypothetical protein
MKATTRILTLATVAMALSLIPTTADAQGVLFVENNNVGVGIASPTQAFEVFSNSGPKIIQNRNTDPAAAERILFRLINNGKTRFVIENTQAAKTWTFDNDGNFTISQVGTGANEFSLTGTGNLTIRGTLTQGSDVNSKTAIEAVNELEILERVIGLPIAEWSYKDDGPSVRHIGPMAQDFYDTFSVGESRPGISSIDTGGVALAAIKGLHSVIDDKDRQIQDLQRQIDELRSLVLAGQAK